MQAQSRGGAETIDEADVARFDRLGADWWDPRGPMRMLHRYNPLRVGWIGEQLAAAGLVGAPGDRLDGLALLDVGCGGGLLSEALAARGARVVGIDPAPNNIAVARRHAAEAGLAIDYRETTVEALATGVERFDAVVIMEVIEHVRETARFVREAAALLRPGGMLFGATLNRTAKSYALAIVGAEYVLGWLPRGTHDWRKFVTPAEFARLMQAAGVAAVARTGVAYDPLGGRWRLSPDDACNYMIAGRRS